MGLNLPTCRSRGRLASIINRRTARSLDLTLPRSLLGTVDEMLEERTFGNMNAEEFI